MEENNLKKVNEEEILTEETKTKEQTSSKKMIWIAFAIGIAVGIILMIITELTGVINFADKVVAKTNQGKITESMVYEDLIGYYSIDYMLETVDEKMLSETYKLTEEQEKEVDEQVEQCFELYSLYYGYTEEQFLSANGFASEEQFRNFLALDYKRNLVYLDYLEGQISEEDVKTYYDENVYGEIDTKHILVQVTDDVTEEAAKKKAQEIIKKLDSGEEFDKVAEEYGDEIIFEELGYNGFDSGLVSEYVEASKDLENETYSKEPVKTSYGYHVIYKIDQKEMPSLEDVKDDILAILGEDLEEEDQYIRYKALIKFREENGLEFKDDKYKTEYEEYCEQYGV